MKKIHNLKKIAKKNVSSRKLADVLFFLSFEGKITQYMTCCLKSVL